MKSKASHLVFGLALCLFLAALGRYAANRWIDRTILPITLAETSVEIRDREGALLRAFQVGDGIWRLRPGPVDPGFVDMLLRYEDKRFRTHAGIDPLAMLRAAGQAIRHGRVVSGGSTLTMQVARLLEDGPTGRWTGKLRQIRVALALERRLGKDQILNLYLTHAPYGRNLEGVRAATLAWFGKEPRRLTPAEAALLVALPQAPERRRPDRFAIAARDARDRVLRRMASQDILTTAEADAALSEPVPAQVRPFPQLAPHLSRRIRAADPGAGRHDTTLSAGVQKRLEQLAHRSVPAAGSRVSIALLVADHSTGEVISSVGSAGFTAARDGFVDMTQAVRSPGSTLKPLIYGLAFDQGLAHPETLIHDGPVTFGRYAPQNFDGGFRGDVRIREALQMSLNIPVVRLADELGPSRIMAGLRRAGTDPRLPGGRPGLAIALGGIGMSLQDLVQLYAGIAQAGQGLTLRHLQADPEQRQNRLISAEAAWHLGDILAGLAPPSGAAPGVLAYKTGTSYGHRDAWAIGFDGRHVIGVWMGRPDGTPVPGAFGGDLAAPVLFEAFGRLKPQFDALPPPPPATLIVGAAQLPLPLRQFRPRDAVFDTAHGAPQLTFPPDGATLTDIEGALTVKLRGGQTPFTVLANGEPVITGLHQREFSVFGLQAGYSTLLVLDRAGLSDRVQIFLQ